MRYFRTPGAKGEPDHFHRVPSRKTLDDVGVDPAKAHEVPRAPRDHERWDSAKGCFVKDVDGAKAAAMERRRKRREWHDDIDARLDDLTARLAELEQKEEQHDG